ncbi:MAG: TIM barrel protein [Gaiellaceae bacterium]
MNARGIAAAPVSWGVWERTIERDDLVPPAALLDSVRSLGFSAIELGPPGYFGANGSSVRAELAAFDLELVGAFTPLRLTGRDDQLRDDIAELDRTLAILADQPAAVALLADAGTPERFAAAGRPDELRRTALRGATLDAAVARLAGAAERCRAAGVAAALHPEVGSFVESPQEIETFLARVDVDLCLDTGHIAIGGGDPVAVARELAERIRHVHLKDVSSELLARLRAGDVDVETAWEQGLFCTFGDGEIDLAGVLAHLSSYDGWLVVEQDRIAVQVDDVPAVREAEQRNLEFVRARVEG